MQSLPWAVDGPAYGALVLFVTVTSDASPDDADEAWVASIDLEGQIIQRSSASGSGMAAGESGVATRGVELDCGDDGCQGSATVDVVYPADHSVDIMAFIVGDPNAAPTNASAVFEAVTPE
jgi:hypothetical protein